MFRSARIVPSFRSPLAGLLALAILAPMLAACGPSNRLREVSLDQSRVAIVAAIPPHPRVMAGSPAEGAIDPYDPIGTAVRVGTAAEKYRQARRAQARLDSAVAQVDVADRIARQVLTQSAELMRFQPASRPSEADFLLDLRIRDYALIADSFEGAVYFIVEGDLLLLDAASGRELWDGRVHQREKLTGSLFGLPPSAGNVITGRALAGLSSDEMAEGLSRIADYAAQRVVERLRRDYARSRR